MNALFDRIKKSKLFKYQVIPFQSDFEGNSAAGFGLKDGSQSSYSSTEANAMVGPTSPQWSVSTVPSSRVEFRQPKNTCQKDATPQPVVPPVMESQNQNNAVEEGFEHSMDLEDSGVTSVLSAELLALDEVKVGLTNLEYFCALYR